MFELWVATISEVNGFCADAGVVAGVVDVWVGVCAYVGVVVDVAVGFLASAVVVF